MMGRLASRLHAVRSAAVTAMFVFWCVQFTGWLVMMFVVEIDPKPFTGSLLYTVQISHWALVEAAGTAALSSWALIQAKHNARGIAALHEHVTATERNHER